MKSLRLFLLLTFVLQAENIKLTSEQENNWQIKTEKPQSSDRLPLGEFMIQVVTPPSLLHTISLPFEANVKELYVANYQSVTRGQMLAKVTGTEWIEIQQRAISDAIELKHHAHLAERKNMLCKEEIIPQKECVAANAELEADKIKIAASKALLKSYGANRRMITDLFAELRIFRALPLKSKVDGRVIGVNASPGKSTSPSEALFIIQQKGSLWLESEIEAERVEGLRENQEVHVELADHSFDTVILQLSPVVNPDNQTRQIRFLVPLETGVLSGLRSAAKITLSIPNLKLKKTSVIKDAKDQIVFVKSRNGYDSVVIEILGEDNDYYYVKRDEQLQNGVAVTSVAILKNMMGNEDE